MSKPHQFFSPSQIFKTAARHYLGSGDAPEVRSVLLSLFLKGKFRWEYTDIEELQSDLDHRGYSIFKAAPGKIAFKHKYGGYEVFPVATAWKSIAAILKGQRDLKDPRENEQYSDDDVPFY